MTVLVVLAVLLVAVLAAEPLLVNLPVRRRAVGWRGDRAARALRRAHRRPR